jgi:hypothetical protein
MESRDNTIWQDFTIKKSKKNNSDTNELLEEYLKFPYNYDVYRELETDKSNLHNRDYVKSKGCLSPFTGNYTMLFECLTHLSIHIINNYNNPLNCISAIKKTLNLDCITELTDENNFTFTTLNFLPKTIISINELNNRPAFIDVNYEELQKSVFNEIKRSNRYSTDDIFRNNISKMETVSRSLERDICSTDFALKVLNERIRDIENLRCGVFTTHKKIKDGINKRELVNQTPITPPPSPIYLSKKTGEKIDFLRIINSMFEAGMFTDEYGNKAIKKEAFKAFGNAVNLDLSDYQNLLSKSKRSKNSDGNTQQTQIFDRLKEISIEKTKK